MRTVVAALLVLLLCSWTNASWIEGDRVEPLAENDEDDSVFLQAAPSSSTVSSGSGSLASSSSSGSAALSGSSGSSTPAGSSGPAPLSSSSGSAAASGSSGSATASGSSGSAMASGSSGSATASGSSGSATAPGSSGSATALGSSSSAASGSGSVTNGAASRSSAANGTASGSEGAASLAQSGSSSGSGSGKKKSANDSATDIDPHEQAAKDKGKAAMKKMIKWRSGQQSPWQKRTTDFLKNIPPPPAKHFMGTWYNAGCLLMNNVTKCGKPPSGRGGHTATRVGNKVFVFGGCYLDYGCFNDMYVLEGTNMTWTKMSVTGQVPIPRMGHTATRVGHQIMVFGGSTEDGALDDMYVFNTDTGSWIKPAVSGNAPSAREEHTAVRANNKIFIYGGLAPDGTILGDLHVFDAEFNLWFNNPPQTGHLPSPRSGHSAVMYENRMFVFGGHSTEGTLNELMILDTQLMSWFSPTVSGAVPKPRQDHAAVMIGYKMIVYGGCSYPDRVCNNDAIGLNVVTGKWAPVDALGSTPSAREGHTLERLDQNRVVMIGGCKLDSGCFHDVHIMENTTNRCPRDCLKRGKCKRDDKSRSSCECAIGYSGVYCRKIVPCPNNCSSDGATPRGQCGTTKKNALFHACKCESGWGGLDCSKVKVAAGSGSGKKSGAGSGSSSGGLAGGSSGAGSAAIASGSVASSSTASESGSASVPSTSGSTSSSGSASSSGSDASTSASSSAAGSASTSTSSSSSASTSSSASSTSSESGGGSASIFSATSKSAAAPQGSLQATFRKLRGALIDPHEFADVAEDSAKAALVAPEEAEKSESDSDSDSFSMSGSGSQEPPPPPPTKKTTCPGDCNKHGKCKNSKCYCEAGFTTDDCSVSVEDYEKTVDPGALVEKDLLGMFIACFVGGCVFVGVIQCGTWCWARAKKKLRNEPDSDSDE